MGRHNCKQHSVHIEGPAVSRPFAVEHSAAGSAAMWRRGLWSLCCASPSRNTPVPQNCGGARALSFLSAIKEFWPRQPGTEQRSAHGTVWEDENRCGEELSPLLFSEAVLCWSVLLVLLCNRLELLQSLNKLKPLYEAQAAVRSWMERGGAALLRHLQHERGRYKQAMSWSKHLQKQLRDEISARHPDALVKPLLSPPCTCPKPFDRRCVPRLSTNACQEVRVPKWSAGHPANSAGPLRVLDAPDTRPAAALLPAPPAAAAGVACSPEPCGRDRRCGGGRAGLQ